YYYGEDLKKLPVVFVEVYSLENAFRMLLKGRVDLVVEDVNVGLYRAKQMGIVNKISYLRRVIIYRDPSYVAFAKKPGYDKLAEEFSEELKKFKKTEEYFKIIKNYGLIEPGNVTTGK
ncbi:MAG: transporter substrate-binding domain-containing protein, partial [Thermotogaceae bacterium]|nr:transporter substrate-binding domain-containing protein [Thermotogaceae bacterium]